MKAIVLNQHGAAETLKIGDVENPSPKNNEVLVRVEAASLNHVDVWIREGSPAYPVTFPHILGADGAGVVEAIGSEAEGVSPGDRVVIVPGISCGVCSYCKRGLDNQCELFEILGAKRQGTYAEFVVVPDQNVLQIPDEMTFQEAAAFPLAYLTAWHMLMGRAKITADDTILVVGASAGVSIAAIQIAKWKRCRVLAVTSSAAKAAKIKSAGADEIFILTDEKKDFSQWALDKTAGNGVSVVVEHVGPATFEQSVKSLARYGRLVTCGATTGPTVSVDLRTVFRRDIAILGAWMGTQKEFHELANVVFSGQIRPIIAKTFPLDDAAQAHAFIDARQQVGKIVLTKN